MAYARTSSVPAAVGAAMTRADVWLRAEEVRLRRERPAVERTARVLLGRGVPLVVLATVVAAVVPQYLLGPGGDATAFADAGRVLWSCHALDAFADPYVQTGPLFLAGTGLGARVGDLIGVAPWVPATVLWSTVAALLLLRVTGDLRPGTAAAGRRPATTLAALVITLSGSVSVAAAYAHLDDLVVGLLLTLATVHGCRGRARAVGLLLGAAIGVKLWAVLGIPVLLVLVARRQAMRAGTIAAVLAACCYLPFLLGGAVGTFSYAWGVDYPAPVILALSRGTTFTWQMRACQAVLVLVATAATTQVARRRPMLAWAPVAALVATRILTDPDPMPYYWSPLFVCLLLALWATGDGAPIRTAVWSFLLIVPSMTLAEFAQARAAVYGSVLTGLLGIVVLGSMSFVLARRRTARASTA